MDRISLLEDKLILGILSNLPYDKVVSTCVLSKRWKDLWQKASKMDVYLRREIRYIHEEYNTRPVVEDCIFYAMASKPSRVVHTLRLHVAEDVLRVPRYEIWTAMAVARGLRELELDIKGKTNQLRIWIPASFYHCQTIVKLKLKNFCLIEIAYQVCLKSLKTLELDSMRYDDEALVSKLVSGCPILEELVMYQACAKNEDLDLETFTVNVTAPSLLRLTIHDFNYGEEFYTRIYVINTPSLKYFEIAGYEDFEITFVQIPLELVEANTRGLGLGIEEKLLRSLCSATRLSLASYQGRSSIDNTVFHRLVDLELSTDERGWWDLLTYMINHSPALRILRLIGLSNPVRSPRTWIQPKNPPIYLETLVWKAGGLPREEQKEVVKYLVRNAKRLKRATLSSTSNNSKEEKIELLKELTSVVRPANSCELLLN